MEIESKQPQCVLILGGTSFMGKQLLDQIAAHPAASQLQVYYINRGKKYWNYSAKNQHPNFTHYFGDRNDHDDFTKLINFLNGKLSIDESHPWRAVIDFTAYKWRDLQSSIKALKGKIQRYIFISSQSIYNTVSEKLDSPVSELDFDIEHQYKTIKKSKGKTDKYGYEKMKCEIYLQRTQYIPYVALRLPDVIGPFDNTDRFWCYVKWLQHNAETQQGIKYPIQLSEDDQKNKLNFVYSIDVAKFIVKLVMDLPADQIPSGPYNLLFNQNLPTLRKFIELISKHLKIDKVDFKSTKSRVSNNFYPSTRFGYITAKMAVEKLGWRSTPLDEAIRHTVDFFLNAVDKYPIEKSDMDKKFRDDVIKT